MEGFNTYKINRKHKRGITDLKCIYAFLGGSQGDETETNDVESYKSGWLVTSELFKDIDCLDQEAVNKRSLEIQKENEARIAELKEQGLYGEEYDNQFTFHFKAYDGFNK